MPRWLGLAPAHSRNCRAESLSQSILETSAPLSMAVEKGAKTAVVWLLFTLPLSLLEGVFSQNGPQRSRARRCCAAKRTLHGEDRSEILDKRERGGPKWTAKMAQSLTASDTPPNSANWNWSAQSGIQSGDASSATLARAALCACRSCPSLDATSAPGETQRLSGAETSKLPPLLMPMPTVTFTNHLAIQHLQCRKQRGGAIALVVVRHRTAPAFFQRQPWLRPI